jgi:hypothetical protein
LLFVPFIAFFVGIYISVLKWQKILSFYGFQEKIHELYKAYLVGVFYNNFLPSSVGGDIYRLFRLNKKLKNKKIILTTIILERGFGYFALLFVSLLLTLFWGDKIIQNRALILIALAIFLLLVSINIFFFFNFKKLTFFSKFNVYVKFLTFIDGVKRVSQNKRIVVQSLGLSIIFTMLSAISLWVLFLSLGSKVDFLAVFFVSSITQVISIIPISLNNIGVSEGLHVFLFSFFGVNPSLSLSVSLIGRAVSLVSSLAAGLITIKE